MIFLISSNAFSLIFAKTTAKIACFIALLHLICGTNCFQLHVHAPLHNKLIKLELNNNINNNSISIPAAEVIVDNVKELIMKAEQIPTDQQTLWYEGMELIGERTLFHYKIEDGARLELRLIPFVIEISQMMSDNTVHLEVQSLHTVNNVMQMLLDKGITIVAQALYIKEQPNLPPLLGNKTLAHYGINAGTKLELFLLPKDGAAMDANSSALGGCCTVL
ncbi:hypothetical protein niasHT_015129 [Heterodera trifolii]|uniref:Ubiquitin-like domain-containing protein n=1 Tax=Heterodera trifolii TaxID=157864 RepID=A0ABD2L9Q7_9BILA